MQKVAVINSVCFQSTGKIASGLNRHLNKNGYDSVLCYGFGDGIQGEPTYKIETEIEHKTHAMRSRLFGDEGSGSFFATKKLIEYLRQRNTDTVYLISIHGYYINRKLLFDYLSKASIKVVYVMIDEHAFLGKCGYSDGCNNYETGCGNCPQIQEYPKSLFFDRTRKIFKIKQEGYARIKDIVFVGPEYTIESAKKSPLFENKRTEILDEAIDVSFFCPRNTEKLKKELGIDDQKKIIVCVAPYSYERKGCKYFLELAEKMITYTEYVFVHVGFNGDTQICPENYIPIGFVSDQDKLAEYYSLGDLFVFPSLLDTMPNACLEAMSCGTPLLGFEISGMPYIADESTGTFVKARDVEALMDVVLRVDKKDDEVITRCRNYAISRYDNRLYFEKLTAIGKKAEERKL